MKPVFLSKRKIVILISCFFINLFCLNLGAQTATIAPIEVPNNWEIWQNTVPSSTNTLAGIQFLQSGLLDDPSVFHAFIPENIYRYLSVVVKSKDGRYRAQINYDISKLGKGNHHFIFPTVHKSELKEYNKRDVAILCAFKNTLEEKPISYTIAGWNDISNQKNILIQILHNRNANLKIEWESSETSITSFKALSKPAIDFTQACVIDYNQIKRSNSVWLSIEKRVGPKFKYESSKIDIVKQY